MIAKLSNKSDLPREYIKSIVALIKFKTSNGAVEKQGFYMTHNAIIVSWCNHCRAHRFVAAPSKPRSTLFHILFNSFWRK